MSNSPHKGWWDSTPPPLYVGRSPGGQEGQFLAAFPTANPINPPFSHGEHHVPPGPGDGGARGGETAAPILFRMADAHFSPYINPPSLPGRLFPPTKPAQAESLRGLPSPGQTGKKEVKKFKKSSKRRPWVFLKAQTCASPQNQTAQWKILPRVCLTHLILPGISFYEGGTFNYAQRCPSRAGGWGGERVPPAQDGNHCPKIAEGFFHLDGIRALRGVLTSK